MKEERRKRISAFAREVAFGKAVCKKLLVEHIQLHLERKAEKKTGNRLMGGPTKTAQDVDRMLWSEK